MKIFIILCLLAIYISPGDGACCHPARHIPPRECWDCSKPTPFCGHGRCNMFGCGCSCRYYPDYGRSFSADDDDGVINAIKKIDGNGDDKLTFKETVFWLNEQQFDLNNSVISLAFNDLDVNGDGLIDANEIDGEHKESIGKSVDAMRFDEPDLVNYGNIYNNSLQPMGGKCQKHNCTHRLIQLGARPGDLVVYRLNFPLIGFHFLMYVGRQDGKYHQVVETNGQSGRIVMRDFFACNCNEVFLFSHDRWARIVHFAWPRSDAVQRALNDVNQERVYHYLSKNCEYYSTLWRYGVGFSKQLFLMPRYWFYCDRGRNPPCKSPRCEYRWQFGGKP